MQLSKGREKRMWRDLDFKLKFWFMNVFIMLLCTEILCFVYNLFLQMLYTEVFSRTAIVGVIVSAAVSNIHEYKSKKRGYLVVLGALLYASLLFSIYLTETKLTFLTHFLTTFSNGLFMIPILSSFS